MSQNVTHKKKIARALVARTGMSYTHARRLVLAAAEAGVLEPPFSDERLPVVVDAILGSPWWLRTPVRRVQARRRVRLVPRCRWLPVDRARRR